MVSMVQRNWMRLCTIVTQKEILRARNQCIMKELMILNDPIRHFFNIAKYIFRYGQYCPIQQRVLGYEVKVCCLLTF